MSLFSGIASAVLSGLSSWLLLTNLMFLAAVENTGNEALYGNANVSRNSQRLIYNLHCLVVWPGSWPFGVGVVSFVIKPE